MLLLDVVCPEGVGEGDALTVEHEGCTYEVVVPCGICAGAAFQVDVVERQPRALPPWWQMLLETLLEDHFDETTEAWCDRECRKFIRCGEQQGFTLEQSACHQQYCRFYETRIESYLRRIPGSERLSSDEFLRILLQLEAAGVDDASRDLVHLLLLVQDFEAFALMMQERAAQE